MTLRDLFMPSSLLCGSSLSPSSTTVEQIIETAAGLLTKTRKRDHHHNAPVGASLHELPIKCSIHVKIVLITFDKFKWFVP